MAREREREVRASGRIRETRDARSIRFSIRSVLEKDDKSERTPVYLPVRSRESKRNIGNVLAGYLTNCYKLRRAFSRRNRSSLRGLLFLSPSSLVSLAVASRGRPLLSSAKRYGGDHMVLPYVRRWYSPLMSIASTHVARRCLDDGIGRDIYIYIYVY